MDQNDLPLEVVLHRIGTCPICRKGQMLQGSAGWTCDYFKSLQDKCSFTIFAEYDGYRLVEDDALELMRDGITGERQFHTLAGVPFTGRLKLDREKQKVRVVSNIAYMDVPCPNCGAKVRSTGKGYGCENFFRDWKGHCNLWIPREVCGRTITPEEAEQILLRGYTDVLDGFEANGKTFSSCLVIDSNGNVSLNGDICQFPKCGGRVYAGIKGYNCSNYRNPAIRCDFVIWRKLAGHDMTVDEVRTLCTNGHSHIMTFYTKEGKAYDKRLVITPEGTVRMV